MNREQLQMAHLLWRYFGLNPIDYSKLAEDDQLAYAEEVFRIERKQRGSSKKAI